MDNLAFVLRKVLGVTNHAVVKTGTNCQQHIAMLHGVIGFDGAVHAQHAEKLRRARWVCAQTHQGIGAGIAEHVDQGAQFLRRIAQQHTATGINVGTLGRHEQLQSLADLPAMALAHGVVGAHLHICGVAVVRGFLERHVFGNVHHYRSRTAAARNVKSLFHDHREIAHIADQEIVFDDRTRDAHGVALLEGV